MKLDHTYYTVYIKDIDTLKAQDNSIGLFFRNILSGIYPDDDKIYISVKTKKGFNFNMKFEDGYIKKEPIVYDWNNLPVDFIGFNYSDTPYDNEKFKYKGNITKILRKEKLDYLNSL